MVMTGWKLHACLKSDSTGGVVEIEIEVAAIVINELAVVTLLVVVVSRWSWSRSGWLTVAVIVKEWWRLTVVRGHANH